MLKTIFSHHRKQENGYKQASERNSNLEKELFDAQEQLLALKNATIGKDKSKAEKERELRAALDRNLDLQDQLRGAQEQLSKIPKKTWKKVQKNWYYNQEEAVKSAELYGKFE